MKSDLIRFLRGFVYAWNGICAAVREERNFRFHLCAAVYVFAAAYLAELNRVEVSLFAVCVFAMLGMELMNSAVERAVDKPDTTHWWSAGAAKDMAAGGVLVTAVGAVAVGVCLFGRAETLRLLWSRVTASPMSFFCWCVSLAAAFWFIFRFNKKENTNAKNNSQ